MAANLQGIAGDEDINMVGGGILPFGEDANGLNAHPVVSGNGGVLPVIADQLLLPVGLGAVNTKFIILWLAGVCRERKTEMRQSPSVSMAKFRGFMISRV